MNLELFFGENPHCALAFSGGVDSAYLLYAAKHYGAQVKAYYVKTAFQPMFELRDAQRLAEELDAEMEIVPLDILESAEVAANPSDRCYYCKKMLFTAIVEKAALDGYTVLLDGTNASDDASDRPGMRAIRELCVRSPLRECGLTKAEVRRLSREAGLFTWNKPAYACLATRISTGTKIEPSMLRAVEKAEDFLTEKGFSDFRVRMLPDRTAKLQVTEHDLAKLYQNHSEIYQKLSPLFTGVTLDMKARQKSE